MLERKLLISAGIIFPLTLLAGSHTLAYAFYPMPEGVGVFVSISAVKQNVEAGETASFHMTVMDLGSYNQLEPFEGWVNLTVGSGPVKSSGYTPLGWSEIVMNPLPEGLKAKISNVYINRNMVNGNFSIQVAPDMPEFDILIVVKAEGMMNGHTTMRFESAQLHVTPSSTPINTTRTYTVLTKTVTQPQTVVTTTVYTTTAATLSTALTSTTTTTLSNTFSTTITSTERIAEPSIYAWAMSATVAAVVLAVVLTLQRRRTK